MHYVHIQKKRKNMPKRLDERRVKSARRKDRKETWREGPGDQPGMERNDDAGPIDAGSAVVATTSITISLFSLRPLLSLMDWSESKRAALGLGALNLIPTRTATPTLVVFGIHIT